MGEEFEAGAESGCIFVGDGEDSDAALRTAWAADEVLCAAEVGVSHGGVDDLNETVRRHAIFR